MKRYALVACGPEKDNIREIFASLSENGCVVDSCLLTSFGSGFGATIIVRGKSGALSKTVRAFKGSLVKIKSGPAGQDHQSLPGNIQITVYGPARPETLRLLIDMVSSVGAEITEIESKSVGDKCVIALQARCPGKISDMRARLKELSKKLGLKASLEKITAMD